MEQVFVLLCLLALVNGYNLNYGNRARPHSSLAATLANEFQLVFPENIKSNVGAQNDYTIVSVSPLVINNNDEVIVTFQSQTPSKSDWIAAYAPAGIDITSYVPVKYGFCDETPSYLDESSPDYGKGSLIFNFTNLRTDISFVYFTNGTTYPIEKGRSSVNVTFANFNEQLRPRVTPTGFSDVFTVAWSSYNNTKPVLKWGTSNGNYNNVVSATTDTITIDEVCGAPANTTGWWDLGLIHTSNFTGITSLPKDSKIYYIFGDEDMNMFSSEHTFYVPPSSGEQPSDRPTTIILYDDLGRGSTDDTYTWYEYGRPAINTTMAVNAEILNGNIDAVYHGGDISYATGYLSVWDFFMNMISPVAGSVLYLSTVGNHESDWHHAHGSIYDVTDSGGECGVLTTTLLQQPSPSTLDAPWWSYDIGIVHLVGMSTEHNFTIGSPQYQWLENDLASVNRTKTPWIIFGGHRAMYINSNYGGPVTSDISVMDALILNIEPLLFKYRVNIGFYGHNHVVQRQAAVYNKQVVQCSTAVENPETKIVTHYQNDPQATVQMVVGTGGAGFTVNAYSGNEQPAWCEDFFYLWGYTKVYAYNSTYLYWEWINSANNEVMDRMVVTQTTNFDQAWSTPPEISDLICHSVVSSNGNTGTTAIIALFTIIGAVLFLFGMTQLWVYIRGRGGKSTFVTDVDPLLSGHSSGSLNSRL